MYSAENDERQHEAGAKLDRTGVAAVKPAGSPIDGDSPDSAIENYAQAQPAEPPRAGSLDPIWIEMPPGLEDIVPGYLEKRRKEVPEMIELLAASNFAGLAVLGHNLKGTGGGYGFPELTRFGVALEQSGKQKDSGTLRTQIAELSSYLDRVQLNPLKR